MENTFILSKRFVITEEHVELEWVSERINEYRFNFIKSCWIFIHENLWLNLWTFLAFPKIKLINHTTKKGCHILLTFMGSKLYAVNFIIFSNNSLWNKNHLYLIISRINISAFINILLILILCCKYLLVPKEKLIV